MTCKEALEAVRRDIGEDIEHVWRDRELYYYLQKGQYKLTNDVKIEEELKTQVSDSDRIAIPATVTSIIEVIAQETDKDLPYVLRAVPVTELDRKGEYSVFDNYIYLGEKLSTVENGFIIRCFTDPDPILDTFGNIIDDGFNLGFCAGMDTGPAYTGFPDKFCIGIVSYAVAQAAKREADFQKYAIEMGEFNDVKRIWDMRERSTPGWLDNTWYGRSR